MNRNSSGSLSGHGSRTGLTRRAALAGVLAGLAAAPLRAQQGRVLVVSRERLLRELAAARSLREAEQRAREDLQSQIDRSTTALTDEERTLAELRKSLPEAEFAARVTRFDRRMRLARQRTQDRVGALQRVFQSARQQVLDALPAVLEAVRVEQGAAMILNADAVLATDGRSDVTDLVIARYDQTVVSPEIPAFDFSGLLIDMPEADE